ncbi:MAG: sugar phosphate isomerase/epimerase [Clostridia bacterium]|nr:sugar phosphate isomerase/epimerase [Clostridia bacterium]
MKLSITTLGCCEWSLNKVVGYFKDIGVKGIEVRGLSDVMNPAEMECFKKENAEGTKKYLRANGMKLVCLDTSCKFDDDEMAKKSITEGISAIDVASEMDIPYIRVFGNKLPELDDDSRDEAEARMINSLRELSDYAEKNNVKVLLETHGNVCNIENIKGALEALSEHKGFGILWDIAHSDTYYKENIEEFYDLIKPLLCHVHMKDHIRLPDHQKDIKDIGEGEIPIEKIVKMLLSDGYDGYFSFEHERKWHPELSEPEVAFPKFVEYMKRFED